MNASPKHSRLRQRPIFFSALIALAIIASLIVWAAKRETADEKKIKKLIAELRAAGGPVSAEDLSRLFPNPSVNEDAGPRLTNILVFAQNHDAPASTPFVMTGGTLARTSAIPESTMKQLRAYREETKTALEQWPSPWPAGMTFASHWERGMEGSSVPKFIQCRGLIHMLTALAMGAGEDGDATNATEMIERSFQFTRTLPSEMLVSHMIRQACGGLACTALERCLNRVRFDDVQLARLAAVLPPTGTNNLKAALRGEHCLAIWAFTEIKGGRRLATIQGTRGPDSWWRSTLEKIFPHPNEYSDRDFVTYLLFCRHSLEAITNSPVQAVTYFTALTSAYSTNVTSEVGRAVPANWTKALRAHYENEAKLDVLRAALAIERFRLAHDGKLPATLSELAPKFCNEVPRDIFDNQPLRFKTLPRGYVVYSIGADLVDDGGVEKTMSATNYDVTVTVER